jgi:hypothetical protein
MGKDQNIPDDDLKLNSLSRFKKNSPKLILEEYSHCEVPAGCGGAVLRWRNPDVDVPVPIWVYVLPLEESEISLDGKPLSTGRLLLSFGEHVLTIHATHIDPAHGFLAFHAIYNEGEEYFRPRLSRKSGVTVGVFSTPDGTWLYSAKRPADPEWTQPEFDHSDWTPMVEKPFEETGEKGRTFYIVRQMTRTGAKPLGIAENTNEVWIRKVFTVERPD